MTKHKNKTPREKVLKKLAEGLESATKKARRRKSVTDRFEVLSNEILELGKWLPGEDSSAQPGWLNEIGSGLANAALGLRALDDCDIDERSETVESAGLLTDGLYVVAESLVVGGKSLAGVKLPKEGTDNRVDLPHLQRMMTDLVFDIETAANRIAGGMGEGLHDEDVATRLPVFSSGCGSRGRLAKGAIEEMFIDDQSAQVEEPIPFTFDRQALVVALEDVGGLLERLLALLLELAALLLVMATGYIPWHCTQECVGDGALLGPKLKSTHAKRQGSGWYQPQISITWEYCCYNLCVLAWNDQFIETVDSGPHNIGRTVGHPNPVTAQNRARAAAKNRATVQAMLRIGAPGAPC